MHRRKFIERVITLASFLGLSSSCKTKHKIKGKIVGASAHVGHLLRDQSFNKPIHVTRQDVVIIGGGVSGLSAARALQKAGITNFSLLDLERQVGGNATCGKNAVSSYPWGAHYVPIPNNTLTEYIEFLKECGVITGLNNARLPIYNEYYLCFDPQERLYINGRWQEGLIPNFGVPDIERREIERFFSKMDVFRTAIGSDTKEAFAIPVDNSSKDNIYQALDLITMEEWLHREGFTGSYLHHYVNYCVRDDFGTPLNLVSAWAGIHYFACRKGVGANASHSDVLTWPEGNGWLIGQLLKNVRNNVQTKALATSVLLKEDSVVINYLDVNTHELKSIQAKQCILAIPQFVAGRLLNDKGRINKVSSNFHYVPWMVANLLVGNLEERSGAPLSWDNVLFNSKSLGYVEATHQTLQLHLARRNLTYYLPLTENTPTIERQWAQSKTHTEWVNEIVADLKRVHPNIEDVLEEVNVMLWGHAMVQPNPGIIHGPIRRELAASINNQIHFAHTDVAGVSLFEEAFYQGLKAAKCVIRNLGQQPSA